MGVGDLLGLDEGGELLARVRASWGGWAAEDPRLRVVDDFDGLRDWLGAVGREEADRVLLALAMLASPDGGGGDVAAAGALAKCLLPGACVTADRISRLVGTGQLQPNLGGLVNRRVDELVAAQLWIEVRSFPWRRLTRVASNILVRTRVAVLYELDDNTRVWRADKTWANTTALEAVTRGDLDAGSAELAAVGLRREHLAAEMPAPGDDRWLTPLERLLVVLAWGCDHAVITPSDRHLLLVVVDEAAQLETRRTRRGRGGLVGTELSVRVGPRIGVSGATVRRRVSRSMAALAASVPRGLVADD